MELKGEVNKLAVSVSRKKSDGDYGSYEVAAMAEVNLAPDADFEAAFKEMDTELTRLVKLSMKAKGDAMSGAAQVPEAPPPDAQHDIPIAPPPEIPTGADVAPAPPPTLPHPDYDALQEEENVILKDPKIAHIQTDNQDAVRVFGERWQQWGVTCWEEVVNAAVESAPSLSNWKQWPICRSGKGGMSNDHRYSLPDKLSEAVVAMKDGKPWKVIELR